jgi:hypothetical protein
MTKFVWSLVEDEFDWYTGIGTTEHCCKRTLLGYPCGVGSEAQISRVDRHDSLYSAFVLGMIEKRGEIGVTIIQPAQGCIAILR